ncbi:histidyl-tRNA synthetase [Boletus reticuloceps]|uniref:histidine--tRNA ligase n=1 Tax=Boletus reticuloceps TaxID=495285 RepID=A0A8I2YY23_9AGAM|nr:histidyl-tRNA synthetase [Boletus reticuloceps]
MSTAESLATEITQQTALVNELRLSNTDPTAFDAARKKLGELKKALGAIGKADGNAGPSDGKDNKKKGRLLLKTAKGTRDYGPAEMFCREYIERIVKDVFTSYGGSCLDTPVFERKDVLTDKYGEDSKLIFDLMDQGGEQLALRYDHTVPLARYLAMSGATVQGKIWQVGKVYRRDSPVMSKGRMREFMQADLDIVGAWDPMIPDAEIVSLLCTILTRLDVGEFTIKINNRKILDGIFETCGVPPEKIRTISSAVDKLDKLPWADVKKEMTDEKGLSPEVADKIGEYVKLKAGGPSLLDQLKADETLMSNPNAKDGILEMQLLFTLLGAYNVLDKISFDMSLARGLDYYTGIIYEAIVAASAPPGFTPNGPTSTPSETSAPPAPAPSKKKSKKPKAEDAEEEEEVDESQVGVGSIAAGGRYDNLVGAFTSAAAGEGKKGAQCPCIGVSIGLDRIFALVWPTWVERGMRGKETMAYVIAVGDGLLEERIKLVQNLREAGIKTDFLAKRKPKLPAQFAAAEKDEVPFDILIGGDELKGGMVVVKEQKWEFVDGKKVKVQAMDQGTKVKREELVDWIKQTPTYLGWSSGRLI